MLCPVYGLNAFLHLQGFKASDHAFEDGGNGGNFGCASLQEFTDRVAALPLCFQPGSRWHCKSNLHGEQDVPLRVQDTDATV